MAVEKLTDWIGVLDEFLESWAEADAALAPGSLTLLGGYGRAALAADRAVVEAAFADVQAKGNAVQSARGDRRGKSRSLQARFVQFRLMVNGQLPGSRFVPLVPATPQYDDTAGTWRDRSDAVVNLWTSVNANNPPVPGFVPPLLLGGGYSLANFSAEAVSVRNAFTAQSNAEQALRLSREQRDLLLAPIRARLVQYRLAAVGALGPESAVVRALPKLSRKRRSRKGSPLGPLGPGL